MRKSRFNEFFIKHNDLDTTGFEKWVFYPGMLFLDQEKWWEIGGIRRHLHEGLDFCFYRDKTGQDYGLTEKTKVPVMYDGEVVCIEDDFLGKSVFVSHAIHDNCGNRLYTIYGHTSPYHGVTIGEVFREGDTIAAIADTREKSTQIAPHLHISVAWLSKDFPPEKLNWKTMSDSSIVTLCNPLEFVFCKYKVEQRCLLL